MEKSYYDILIENIEEDNRAYAAERAARKELKQNRIKNLKLRKDNIRKKLIIGSCFALVVAAGARLFEKKPITVVTNELLADADLYTTENGRNISGTMSEEELVDYIENHGLSLNDIKEETVSRLKSESINPEFGMDKVQRANPEVFEEESKGMSR